MKSLRFLSGTLLLAGVFFGAAALWMPPANAEPPDQCAQPPGPAGIDCRGCPTYVDPVECTVACAGGPRPMTFSNQCFASCSGYVFIGGCTRTGG